MTLDQLRTILVQTRDLLMFDMKVVGEQCPRAGNINQGRCFDFASAVMQRLDGIAVELQEQREDGWKLVRTWVEFEGLHFDAECINGVADPSDLPFFKRKSTRIPAELVPDSDVHPQVVGVRVTDAEETS